MKKVGAVVFAVLIFVSFLQNLSYSIYLISAFIRIRNLYKSYRNLEGYQSSQMGRAVNPLAPAFEGANPSPSTKNTYFY